MSADSFPKLGTTFSQLQCQYLDLDYKEVFEAICTLGLSPMRLCVYWNEVEPIQRILNFDKIDWLLQKAVENALDVIVTVGIKAPRWPGFHFPSWVIEEHDVLMRRKPLDQNVELVDKALTYIEKTVDHIKHFSCVKYWQVENGALNRSPGSNYRYLSTKFLNMELDLVRALKRSEQRILLTLWMSPLPLPIGIDQYKNTLDYSISQADIVGLNVYPRIPITQHLYFMQLPTYWSRLRKWQQKIKNAEKEAWIAEAQAEPWEKGKLVPSSSSQYFSSSPQKTVKLASKLANLNFPVVLLWGCEFWYWCKKYGNPEWWEVIIGILQNASVQKSSK